MKVLIFTEAGNKIGFGHVVRCISLYDELKRNNIDVQFVVQSDFNKIELLENRNVLYHDWSSDFNLERLFSETTYSIIDSYLAPLEVYTKVYTFSRRCLYIDDNNRLNYPPGLVVNPSLEDKSHRYSNQMNVLSGYNYVLLRSAFSGNGKKHIENEIKHIMVVIGATDIHNLTNTISKSILKLNKNYKLDIIVNKSKIDPFLKNNDKVTLYESLDDEQMRALIVKADLVICGAGQTMFELISMNTPFVPIVVAENQKSNAIYLKSIGLIDYADYSQRKNLSEQVLIRIKYYQSYENRVKYYEKALALIDGKGSSRVVKEFLKG